MRARESGISFVRRATPTRRFPHDAKAAAVTLPRLHSQAGRKGDASGVKTQTICPGSSLDYDLRTRRRESVSDLGNQQTEQRVFVRWSETHEGASCPVRQDFSRGLAVRPKARSELVFVMTAPTEIIQLGKSFGPLLFHGVNHPRVNPRAGTHCSAL